MPVLVLTQCLSRAGKTMIGKTAIDRTMIATTMNGKMLAASALLAGLGSVLAWSMVPFPPCVMPHRAPLSQLEERLRRMPVHISEFAPVSQSEPLALPRCGNVRAPEALLTPDPLWQVHDDSLHVRVSFIVGADGHVHSAFILDSGGPDEDQLILRAVRRWRYRPALCNGVPIDSEARIRFGLR